jgi:hypothetical protein
LIFLKLTVHHSTDSGRAGEIYSLVETFPFMLSLSKHARRFSHQSHRLNSESARIN